MEPITDIEARIASSGKLQDIVSALRSMAALRIKQSQDAIEAAQRYSATITSAIASAISLRGEIAGLPTGAQTRSRAVLVFCSEHGFVGNLNTLLLDHVLHTGDSDTLALIVGTRGRIVAEELGISVFWHEAMVAHPAGLTQLIRSTARRLYDLMATGGVGRIDLVFPKFESRSGVLPMRRTLLPFPHPERRSTVFHAPPLTNLPPEILLENLVEEYFFAALISSAAECLYSINRTRFAALSRTQRNIDNKVDELTLTLNERRQEAITDELLDLIAGIEAQNARV